jgi:cytochrome c oxidase subunit II
MRFGKPLAIVGALAAVAVPAAALPYAWQTGLPPAASPAMAEIGDLYRLLFYIATAAFLLLLALIGLALIRFNRRVHPVAVRSVDNPMLEAAWIVVPAIVLVLIAIPALRLSYDAAVTAVPDVVVKAIGRSGAWTYEYPKDGDFRYASRPLNGRSARAAGEPRLMAVDNPLIVPTGKVVEVQAVSADVMHSWGVPELGVKADAIPGRIIRTRFVVLRPGIYYSQCSEFCVAFMPVAVRAVGEEQYESWRFLAQAKQMPSGMMQ